jgi:hypothetical protein
MEYFMRRIIQVTLACIAAGAVTACSDTQKVTDTGIAPTGGVRFINAVNDTAGSGGIDFRFVDAVENNAQYAIPFRNTITLSGTVPASTKIEYKYTAVGARHFNIFLDDTLPAVASQKLKDSTLTVELNHRYTMLLWGSARTGSANPMKLTVIDETCDPGTQIGLRVINATGQALDIRTYQGTDVTVGKTTTTTGTPPATATWASVPPMSVTTCINVAPTPTPTTVGTTTTTVTYKFNVQPAGGGTALFADASALIGQANGTQANGCSVGIDCDATPGTSAAGSAVTAIIFPSSVAGSKAAQFTTPAISFMWDKRPNRLPGT